jgi:hypothetical protein
MVGSRPVVGICIFSFRAARKPFKPPSASCRSHTIEYSDQKLGAPNRFQLASQTTYYYGGKYTAASIRFSGADESSPSQDYLGLDDWPERVAADKSQLAGGCGDNGKPS